MQNIRREMIEDAVCVLTFDRPDSSANIFDRATLEELEQQIDTLDATVRGLVLTSAKPAVFVAGADLHSVRGMTEAELSAFIELGQNVFNKLADLKIPTVAAIHGAAVGGGCEVALACDWRVASPDICTKIGLPETKLGIVPAWGGCTRLPHLIGVPGALDIILGGKTLTAHHARKVGLVDEITARENLIRAAVAQLQGGKNPRDFIHSPAVNTVVDVMIAPRVKHDVERMTHGHYPAVRKAMDVVMQAAASFTDRGSQTIEREAIEELIKTESTKQLLNLFFLQERAKKRSVTGVEGSGPAIAKVAVIGAGVMGAGIAQWVSSRGLRVILRDIHPVRVAAGMETIRTVFADGVKKRVFTKVEARSGLDRVSPAASEVPLKHVDLVIEAAVEKMSIKQDIFRRLDEQVRDDAVLATNTSALSITELAAVTKHPQRVIGIHFFNPVHRMQLVEVVNGRETAPETTQRALRFVQAIGKLPVVVKDSPGFLVNRILLPYMTEAALLFTQGASVEQIDGTMVDFGMPVGPLALTDDVGVDVADEVAGTLSAAFPNRLSVPEILGRMVISGTLGRKTGKGFYDHTTPGEKKPNLELAVPRGEREFTPGELESRMVLAMVNEAARTLEEGIVEKAEDVDFAMVTGTGWAPFRGGPLRYADTVGVDRVVEVLSRLANEVGPRFAPCDRLAEMARAKKRFYED
ncbi:MAG: 3-hydroxyacyl-CoA dehydrogenase NAD-binding domain-containing protein [Chthoniobacteraceae bacterium]